MVASKHPAQSYTLPRLGAWALWLRRASPLVAHHSCAFVSAGAAA